MLVNRIVYGSWVVILLCAVAVAAFNLKVRQTPQQEASLPAQQSDQDVPTGPLQAVGFQDDTPGRLPVVSDKDPLAETKLKELRRIVSEELPSASDEQVQIWAEEFKDVPEQMVRFMLRQKRSNDDVPPALVKPVPSAVAKSPTSGLPESLEAIAHARSVVVGNLMNTNTVGHKAQVVEFATTDGGGVQVAETRYLMTPGRLRQTSRRFDLAVVEGFFVVSANQKSYFTRAGRFTMNAKRRLVLRIGESEYQLDGVDQLPIDVTDFEVSPNGKVTASTEAGPVNLGKIKVATFLDASRLVSPGNCVFSESAESGTARFGNTPEIQQGSLELSNSEPGDAQAELDRLNQWETLFRTTLPSSTNDTVIEPPLAAIGTF